MTLNTSDVPVCCSSDLLKSACVLPQFIEQPRVFDSDDGLGGEVFGPTQSVYP